MLTVLLYFKQDAKWKHFKDDSSSNGQRFFAPLFSPSANFCVSLIVKPKKENTNFVRLRKALLEFIVTNDRVEDYFLLDQFNSDFLVKQPFANFFNLCDIKSSLIHCNQLIFIPDPGHKIEILSSCFCIAILSLSRYINTIRE